MSAGRAPRLPVDAGRRVRAAGRLLVVAGLAGAAILYAHAHPSAPAARVIPQPGPTIYPATGVAAQRQSALLQAEDQRLLALVSSVRFASPPYVQTVDDVDTLVLTAAPSAYGLGDLERGGAAQAQPDGTVLLVRSVFVAPGAALALTLPHGVLHMSSSPAGFTSLVGWKADVQLAGADDAPLQITSWDPTGPGPDTTVLDGRAYVRDVNGTMRLADVDASHLGFWAGRTSGVAWTGSSSHAASGSITNSALHDNHYGAFASEAQGLSVSRSSFSDNVVDGLALHRDTVRTTVLDSTSRGNGRHGFSADLGSENLTFSDVTASGNADCGISFSGAPLSRGPTAGGASTRSYGQVSITGGLLADNGLAGARIVDGTWVSVRGTHVVGNRDGIALSGTAATSVQNSRVDRAKHFGITVTGGSATVSGNHVAVAPVAVRVRDAAVTVSHNAIGGASRHGISITGAADGTSVLRNAIAGRGPSGLDEYRLAAGASVRTSGNDVARWVQDRDDATYWATFLPDHPMLVLWLVVLGMPVLMAVRARRRPLRRGERPYRDDIRRSYPAPRRVDGGRPVPAEG